MGASNGALVVLSGPREALLLSSQGEAVQVTAAASGAGLKRGLNVTIAEAVRVAGSGNVVVGAGPRY